MKVQVLTEFSSVNHEATIDTMVFADIMDAEYEFLNRQMKAVEDARNALSADDMKFEASTNRFSIFKKEDISEWCTTIYIEEKDIVPSSSM